MPPRFLILCCASLAAVIILVWPTSRRPDARASASRAADPANAGPATASVRPMAPARTGGPVVGMSTDGLPAEPSSAVIGAPATVPVATVASPAKPHADASGRLPTHGQVRVDALGNREVRMDNGVTATSHRDALGTTTTRYSNGETATSRTDALGGTTTTYSNGTSSSSRKDALGNIDTTYSDGTRSTTRTDPFGNQVTTYSDGRVETVRPDPFAPKPSPPGRK